MDGASRRGRCAGSPRSAAVLPELLGKALDGVAEQPCLADGGIEKGALSTSFISARLSQRWRSWTTMVDIAFPRDHDVTFVARRAKSVAVQLLHQPRVGTTLVLLFERLGLVNLQDSHGVQGGGCLARSAISFGRESGCQLTGLGRDADGSFKWRRFVGTGALRSLSPPGECPRTPWPLRRRG